MLQRKLASAALVMLLKAPAVFAHPHSFVRLQTEVVAENGYFTALKMRWTMDEIASADLLYDAGDAPAGSPVWKKLAAEVMANVRGQHYFTEIRHNGKKLKLPEQPVSYSLERDNYQAVLNFVLPLATPQPLAGQRYSFATFDPGYYVDMSYAQDSDATLSSALAVICRLSVFTPSPGDDVLAFALSLDKSDAPPEDMNLGKQFAQQVTLLMSVITSSSVQPRRWWQLWPAGVFIVLLFLVGMLLWHYWPQVIHHSARWQRDVNSELSGLLKRVAEHPGQAGVSLLAFSFIYGVLHALGPGHGKVVITTWLATHPSRLKSSLWLTFAASLLQGGVAIVLVTAVLTLLTLPARQLHLSSFWLEKCSYLLVGTLGLLLCWRALKRLKSLLSPRRFRAFTSHQHHEKCGCGHRHLPDNSQMERDDDWRARCVIVLSMGMRPCSGAIMVLLFSKVIGVFGWGMASALAMAAGTSLTIAGLALIVHSFRQLAVRLSAGKTPALWYRVGGSTLALAGGVILTSAAIIMWLSAQPPGGGLRPF